MSPRRRLAVALIAVCAAAGSPTAQQPVPPAAEHDASTLVLGVYTSDRPMVMHLMFRPVVDALARDLARRTNTIRRVDLRIIDSYDGAITALLHGDLDFLRCGPASYVLAMQREPRLHLLVMESNDGEKRFKGVIAVRDDSGIETLADLRGKSFAFGDVNSTIGRYLAQAEMFRAGLRLEDLGRYDFLDRHDRVARAVEIGDFDAGSLKESTFLRAQARKGSHLRALHTFDNVTKPWLARADLPDATVTALRAALLALDDAEALKRLGASGFLPATDDDYAFVREGMRLAERFNVRRADEAAAEPPPGK